MRRNNKGQMQILEVIIVAGMIFIALFFVKNMDVSSYSNIEKENRLETLGEGAFKNLENQPDPYGNYDNKLIAYIKYDMRGNSFLQREFDSILPEGTLYKLSVFSISELVHNFSAYQEEITEILAGSYVWIGEETRVSKLVVIEDEVYEVVLSMWFNSGG